MKEEKKFFVQPEIKKVFNEVFQKVNGLKAENDFESGRNSWIVRIVQRMITASSTWDQNCQWTIKKHGELVAAFMSNLIPNEKHSMDNLFSILYLFVAEFILFDEDDQNVNALEGIERFIEKKLVNFDQNAQRQITYAKINMPTQIINRLLKSISVTGIAEFGEIAEDVTKKTTEFDETLTVREKRVQELAKTLEKHETAFNFVGLEFGFRGLAITKKKEINLLFCSLLGMGVLLSLIPIMLIGIILWNDASFVESLSWKLYVPSLSIVVIFLYFFRVILHNYKSAKSQLLQIELRRTLCRFIQSYAKYSSEISSKENNSLAKFENIIFSGIVSDEGKLPTTFDGMDQIVKLLKVGKLTQYSCEILTPLSS